MTSISVAFDNRRKKKNENTNNFTERILDKNNTNHACKGAVRNKGKYGINGRTLDKLYLI